MHKKVLRGIIGGKRPLGRPRSGCEDNIKVDVQEMRWVHGLNLSASGKVE
jgi:hypothetical protein